MTEQGRKIVDARADEKGNIEAVKFADNKRLGVRRHD